MAEYLIAGQWVDQSQVPSSYRKEIGQEEGGGAVYDVDAPSRPSQADIASVMSTFGQSPQRDLRKARTILGMMAQRGEVPQEAAQALTQMLGQWDVSRNRFVAGQAMPLSPQVAQQLSGVLGKLPQNVRNAIQPVVSQIQAQVGVKAITPNEEFYGAMLPGILSGQITGPLGYNAQGQLTQAPSAPTQSTGGGRPWYMNYGHGELETLLSQKPEMAILLPDDFLESFRNEFFLNSRPDLIARLSDDRIYGRGRWAGTGFAPEVAQQYRPAGGGDPVQPGMTVPGQPGISVTVGQTGNAGQPPAAGPAGDDARWYDEVNKIYYGPDPAKEPIGWRRPTWQELEQFSGAPLPPRIRNQIVGNVGAPDPGRPNIATGGPQAGGGQPTWHQGTNIPFFSPQTLNRLSPSETEFLGVTVNATGGREEDFFTQSRRLGAAPRAGGFSYSGAPRYGI